MFFSTFSILQPSLETRTHTHAHDRMNEWNNGFQGMKHKVFHIWRALLLGLKVEDQAITHTHTHTVTGVTSHPVIEGTFLEAPCKACLIPRTRRQGNRYRGNHCVCVCVFAATHWHSKKKLSVTLQWQPTSTLTHTHNHAHTHTHTEPASMNVVENLLHTCEGNVSWYEKTSLKGSDVLIWESCIEVVCIF